MGRHGHHPLRLLGVRLRLLDLLGVEIWFLRPGALDDVARLDLHAVAELAQVEIARSPQSAKHALKERRTILRTDVLINVVLVDIRQGFDDVRT